jgi:hypothetical protein
VKAASPGSGTPTGTVTFLDDMNTLGSGTLAVVNGVDEAAFTSSTLAVGSHAIIAVYGGDPNLITSSSSTVLTETVNHAKTTAAVVSSANPSASGQAVTFTVTIAAVAPGSGTPTGTVTFKNGSTTLATVALSGGTASFTTLSLAVGTHSITVVYSGDADFKTSTSAVLKQVVQASAAVTAADFPASLVDQALGALPDDEDLPSPTAGSLVHDAALEQVTYHTKRTPRGREIV